MRESGNGISNSFKAIKTDGWLVAVVAMANDRRRALKPGTGSHILVWPTVDSFGAVKVQELGFIRCRSHRDYELLV